VTGRATVKIKYREDLNVPTWVARQIEDICWAIRSAFGENTESINGPYFEIDLSRPTLLPDVNDLTMMVALELYEPTQSPDPEIPTGLRVMVNRYDARILNAKGRMAECANAMDFANDLNRGAREMWRRLIGEEEDRRVQASRARILQEVSMAMQAQQSSIFNNMLDGGRGRNYSQFFDDPPYPTTARGWSAQPQYVTSVTSVASVWDQVAVGLRGEPAPVVEKLVEVIGTRKRKIVLEYCWHPAKGWARIRSRTAESSTPG